jgi:hypothetical protein
VSALRKSLDYEVVQRVAEMTAAELERFCADRQLVYANERDHLGKCCREALVRIIGGLDDAPALSPHTYGHKHGWIGVGSVDVVLRWRHCPATFLELKCGARPNVLTACVWDALKLATALLGGNAGAGYLLAGAPATYWAARKAGAEFFETAEWDTLGPSVRNNYMAYWQLWESERHIPGRVPRHFSTASLGAFQLTIGNAAWELRLARVSPSGDWIDWPPTTTSDERKPKRLSAQFMQRIVGDHLELRHIDDDELMRSLGA